MAIFGIPIEIITVLLILGMGAYAFRERLIPIITQWWQERQKRKAEDAKLQEIYRRIDLGKDSKLSKREKLDSTKELVKKAKQKNKNDLDKKMLR
jgi:hypothetical protein